MIEHNSNSLSVLFFTYRGVLDSFSGFVYSSNDERPVNGDFDGDWHEVKQIEPHWYFVASK